MWCNCSSSVVNWGILDIWSRCPMDAFLRGALGIPNLLMSTCLNASIPLLLYCRLSSEVTDCTWWSDRWVYYTQCCIWKGWRIIQNCWLAVKACLVVRLTVWPNRLHKFTFWHLALWRWNKIHVLLFHLHSWKQWSVPLPPNLLSPLHQLLQYRLWDSISISRCSLSNIRTDLFKCAVAMDQMMKHVMIPSNGIGGRQNHRLRWILTAQK